MSSLIARQNLITVLGKVTAFYEAVEYPYQSANPDKKTGPLLTHYYSSEPGATFSANGVKRARDPFASREEWEKRLTRKLRGKFSGQLQELLSLLGDPPRLENVPADFWDAYGAELRRIVEDTLTDVALDRADDYLRVAPISGVDWLQVNGRAVDWARSNAYELIREITTSQRESVQREISRFYQDGELRIDDIARALEADFGARRAETIAVTEVTRAAVEGEREIVTEIESYGIKMRAIWRTANDDVTCEVCGAKDGEEVDGEDFPPAHPNCRCGVTWEVVE